MAIKGIHIHQNQTVTAIGSLSGSPVNDSFAFERIALPNDVCINM